MRDRSGTSASSPCVPRGVLPLPRAIRVRRTRKKCQYPVELHRNLVVASGALSALRDPRQHFALVMDRKLLDHGSLHPPQLLFGVVGPLPTCRAFRLGRPVGQFRL